MGLELNNISLEEISEGDDFEFRRKLLVSDIESFCELTGDHHPLHTDATYAKENGFNDIIAHGALLTAFSSSVVGMQLPGKNALVLSQSFNYNKPAYPNDELKIKGVVKAIDRRFKTITVGIEIKNQEDIRIAGGSWTVLIRKPK